MTSRSSTCCGTYDLQTWYMLWNTQGLYIQGPSAVPMLGVNKSYTFKDLQAWWGGGDIQELKVKDMMTVKSE